jgi:hypothetical protein
VDRNEFLKPLLRDIVGSRSTREVEQQRLRLVVEWYVRCLSLWLEAAGFEAAALRDLDRSLDLRAYMQQARVLLNNFHVDDVASRNITMQWTSEAFSSVAHASTDTYYGVTRDLERASMHVDTLVQAVAETRPEVADKVDVVEREVTRGALDLIRRMLAVRPDGGAA